MVSVLEMEESKEASEPETKEEEENHHEIASSFHERNFQIGDYLDAQDSVGKWCEAQIVDIDVISNKLLISYLYWSDSFNEWFDFNSNLLAPKDSMTYKQGGELCIGHRIEARDTTNRWIEAEVIDIVNGGDSVLIHYKNWHPKFDEVLHKHSDRIRPYGHFKILNKKSKPLITRNHRIIPTKKASERTRKTTSNQFDRYCNALSQHRLGVKEIDGGMSCVLLCKK